MPGWPARRLRISKRGGALSEYLFIIFLAVVLSLGLVMLLGDNLRALFASADNSLTGVDSSPATRSASSPLPGSLAGLRAGDEITGNRLALMRASLKRELNNPVSTDFRSPSNVHPDVAAHIRKVGYQPDSNHEPPSKGKLALGGLYNGGVGIVKSLARLPETAGRFFELSRQVYGLVVPEGMLGVVVPDPAGLYLLARGVEVGGVRVPGFNNAAESLGAHQENLAQKYDTFRVLAEHAQRFNAIGQAMWQRKSLKPLKYVDADMVVGAVFAAAPSLLVTLLSGGGAAAGAASKVEAAARFSRAALSAGTLLEGLAAADNALDFEQRMQQETGNPDFHIPEHEFVAATSAVAVTAGLAEMLGGKMVWRALPGADDAVGSIVKRMFGRTLTAGNSMLAEGGTETFQEWAANLGQRTYDSDAKLTDGLLQAFFGGMGSSGVFSLPGLTLGMPAGLSIQVLENTESEQGLPAQWAKRDASLLPAFLVQARSFRRASDAAEAWARDHGWVQEQAELRVVFSIDEDLKFERENLPSSRPEGHGKVEEPNNAFNRRPGWTEVVYIDSDGVHIEENQQNISLGQVARQIREQGHPQGQPIAMFIPWSGQQNQRIQASIAERLANELQSPVVAPSRDLHDRTAPLVTNDGSYHPSGRWRVFLPGEATYDQRLAITLEHDRAWQELEDAGRLPVWNAQQQRWIEAEWTNREQQEAASFTAAANRAERFATQHGWQADAAASLRISQQSQAGLPADAPARPLTVPGFPMDGTLNRARAGWTRVRLETSQDGYGFLNVYNGRIMTPPELARTMRELGHDNAPVLLESGFAGNHGVRLPVSLAEQLAQELGVAVMAAVADTQGRGVEEDNRIIAPQADWQTFLPGEATYESRMQRQRELTAQRQSIEQAGKTAMWDEERSNWRAVDLEDPAFRAWLTADYDRLDAFLPKNWWRPEEGAADPKVKNWIKVTLVQLRSYMRAVEKAEQWARQNGWSPDRPNVVHVNEDIAAKGYVVNANTGENRDYARNAGKRPGDRIFHRRPGWTETEIHGSDYGGFGNKQTDQYISPRALADILRAKGHQIGSPVDLWSCNAGRRMIFIPSNSAQKLANELGSPVVAASNYAQGGWTDEQPTPYKPHQVVQVKDRDARIEDLQVTGPRGQWRVFLPQETTENDEDANTMEIVPFARFDEPITARLEDIGLQDREVWEQERKNQENTNSNQ